MFHVDGTIEVSDQVLWNGLRIHLEQKRRRSFKNFAVFPKRSQHLGTERGLADKPGI